MEPHTITKPFTKAQDRDLQVLREATLAGRSASPWDMASSSVARFKRDGLVVAVKDGAATRYVLSEVGRRLMGVAR